MNNSPIENTLSGLIKTPNLMVGKSTYLNILSSNFTLGESEQEPLSKYFILVWNKEHFIEHIRKNEGVVIKDDLIFRVVYHPKYVKTLGRIKEDERTLLSLSFRAPHESYNLPNIVLVSFKDAPTPTPTLTNNLTEEN